MSKVDVIIIGGGPAGSTVGTILKKYSPHLKVTLLEQAIFPRHHIGESMLAATAVILKEMEVYDKVDRFGFPEKLGATYVWGPTAKTWGFEFQEIDGQLRSQGIVLPKEFFKGWQVTRADYDKILLDHAAEFGVDVQQGARVTAVRLEKEARRGVTYVQDGVEKELEAEWVMDCTGQQGLLSNRFKLRDYDERMNNLAIYGYWKGAAWKFEYAGYPNLTRILVASTPHGWIWYIPVRKDVISVGFVTHVDVTRQVKDVRALYFEELKTSSEISELLAKAELTRISPDQKTDLLAERDWSYTCRQLWGDGWSLCGDAAGFVDPILSSGCLLAHENGKKAAYTLNTMFRTSNTALHPHFWSFYESSYRTMLQAYREMASFWYGNNFSSDSWWWQARRLLAQSEVKADLSSRDAFMRLASGYAHRTESFSLFGSYAVEDANHLADHLFGLGGQPMEGQRQPVDPQTLVKLVPEAEVRTGLFYFQGLLHRTPRVVHGATGRYLDLHPYEARALEQLKEGCKVENLVGPDEAKTKELRARSPAELVFQLQGLELVQIAA